MLKRILILMVFSLVFFSSCNKDDKQTQRVNARRALIEKNAEERKEVKAKETIKSKRLIYDINGVIFKKVYDKYLGDYYFYIKLENGGLVEWETTGIKYSAKEIGDSVHFEYLLKNRFSNKAIN